MTRDELLEKLKDCQLKTPDCGHMDADDALLEYIDDDEITEAFEAITRWYD